MVTLFFSIFVEAFSRFHSKLALGDHAVDEFAWFPVVGRVVVDMLVQVQPSVVQQLKGPHGVAEAKLDSHVHVLVGCVPSLYHCNGVLDIRAKQGIHDEPGSVFAGHSVLPNGLAPCRHGLIGGVRGLRDPDHLQQPHDWHRVEEVKTATPIQARYVLHTISHTQKGGVRGKQSCLRASLVPSAKSFCLSGKFSVIASTIRSAEARAVSGLVANVRLAIAEAVKTSPAFWSSLNFFFATRFKLSEILFSALLRISWLMSTRATCCCACAAT